MRAPRADDEFTRILIVITRQIGDVLLTTPLMRAARQRWPQARIDVLGFGGTLAILRGNPDINEIIEVKAGSGWLASFPLIRRLWRRYELALVAQYSDRAHLYGWLSARVRSGQVPAGPEGRWKRRLLHHWVDLGDDQSHVVIEKLKLLSPWVRDSRAKPLVQPPASAELPHGISSRIGGRRYVVFQVPSLVSFKQWPLRHCARLIAELSARNHCVVVTGGPSEQDRQKVVEAIQQSGSSTAIDGRGQLDFNQLTALLSHAAVYVGPDTSVTHLAAACGVATVALYGPIDPRVWGPWPAAWPAEQPYQASGFRQRRGNVVLLQGDQRCVPCNGAGCDRRIDSRSECLETMTVEHVLAEVTAFLGPPH